MVNLKHDIYSRDTPVCSGTLDILLNATIDFVARDTSLFISVVGFMFAGWGAGGGDTHTGIVCFFSSHV